jgi:hypothetical protein
MSDEQDLPNDSNGRRRRRRRRRRRAPGEAGAPQASQEAHDSGPEEEPEPRRGRRSGRRTSVEIEGPVVSVPSTAKNPFRKRSSRARRGTPGSAATRRRTLTKTELESLTTWLGRLQPSLVGALYRGLGGQPDRVGDNDRMIQLSARAIAQGARLGNVLKQLPERDRPAASPTTTSSAGR